MEISTDAGASWTPAKLTGPVHKYAWRRFEQQVTLREGVHTILSRATDERGVTQPIVPAWNPSGYLWNAPDRIDVTVATSGAAARPAPAQVQDAPVSHPGSRSFDTACRVCHDEDLSAQQRLTREGWGREVDKMIRWGARVSPEERGPLVEFLASRWGVR